MYAHSITEKEEGVLNPLKIGGRVLYRKEDVYNNSRLVA